MHVGITRKYAEMCEAHFLGEGHSIAKNNLDIVCISVHDLIPIAGHCLCVVSSFHRVFICVLDVLN